MNAIHVRQPFLASRMQGHAIEHEVADARARVALVPALKISEINLRGGRRDDVGERQLDGICAREAGDVIGRGACFALPVRGTL
ncbi:MAG: hypothetical protein ABI698_01370 [bacterium]